MSRVTVDLQDHSDWVEKEAERRSRSKSYIIRECIAAIRNDAESIFTMQSDEDGPSTMHHDEERTDIVTHDEFEALQDRVAELEQEVHGTADAVEGEESDIEPLLDGWSHGRSEQEKEASHEIAKTSLEWLREQDGEVRKSDVPLDELQKQDEEDRKPQTLWEKVIQPAWIHVHEKTNVIQRVDHRTYAWDEK